MKTAFQAAACVLALGALLTGPAAQATDIAELPLKASVLAKPNVVFGMDDSGSMDWEVLLDTNSGLLYWNGTTGWDSSTGKPLRTSSMTAYAYLFPVGTATGGQIYAYNSIYGQAVPPTDQFAWLRSPRFNPLYYDTTVTYKPWAPAYHDGAVQNYADASTTAALSHPAYTSGPTLDLTDNWNSADANWTANGYRFYVQAGMVLPVGTRVSAGSTTSNACNGEGAKTLTAPVTVAAGRACWASIPYFPATFWHAQACTVGPDCVLGPDGTTTLQRYEIRDGNSFPSGRSYAQEIQNFANWFTYYRKRKLMAGGAMGRVLEDMTGLRLGTMLYSSAIQATPPSIVMRDADAASAAENRRRAAGDFYKLSMSSMGTPTHKTMQVIGDQFNSNTGIVEYACQRNAMFVVTDGFANAPTGTYAATVPSYDPSTFGAGAPYQTTTSGSLADLALAYYTIRLRTDLPAGKVPPSASDAPNADKNTNLHVNTYAVSLGVRGAVWPTADDPFDNPPTWPTPVPDTPSMLDDLWHATINGRGLMFLASSPDETAAGIRAVLDDIVSQRGAQGGVAVSTVNLSRGDNRAYFGTYNPSGWQGDITAHPIDAATGEVDPDTTLWSAGSVLLARDWTTRVIASATASGGVAFTAANVGATVNPSGAYGSDTDVVNYLRGDRSHEGTQFRVRQSLIGAVINSEPAVQRSASVIYVQSGEGMLHAIDTAASTGGTELWAFVPPGVLPRIGQTVSRSYVFRTQLDGSPTLGAYAGGTLLVAGMGVAGRGFYALDVSSPRGLDEAGLASTYKWQFPAAGDGATAAKVGQSMGRARIVKTGSDGHVVLVTSGYNNDDGRGRLWMLDAGTGTVIHEFDTGVGSSTVDAGLAQVVGFGESNGTVRYVYGGDLLGNVWRFDLQGKGTPHLLATLKDGSGVAQPVTAAPELTMIDGKRVVIVGTGRLLDIADFGSTRTQTLYAIADGTTLTSPRTSLVEQVYDPAATEPEDAITGNPVDWSTDRGWYVDLPEGEQLNTTPTIAYGAVAVVSNENGGTDCTASSRLYVLDVKSGSRFAGADFVSSEISGTANSSGVTALSTSSGKIVGSGQDADGKPWEREIVRTIEITPAKNAWREIRRQ